MRESWNRTSATRQLRSTPQGASICCGIRRKQSGGVWCVPNATAGFSPAGGVRWYPSGVLAERGLGPVYGGFQFSRHRDAPMITFALGARDGPTGRPTPTHIFVADKGNYDEIADGLPQKEN